MLRKLEECGLKVDVKKCDFLRKELELLGFVIDKRGLHKAPKLITVYSYTFLVTEIFGYTRKEMPLTIANRLQRWAYFLSGFTYNIEYVRSKDNENCDALFRLPIADSTPVFEKDFERLSYIEKVDKYVVVVTDVQRTSKKCKVLSRVMRFVREGWLALDQLSEEEKKYREKSSEFTLKKECLLR
ncbi:integrase core domain protein, partial [Lasius niger]